MKPAYLSLTFFLLARLGLLAQSEVIVPKHVSLTGDSIESIALIKDLNQLLAASQEAHEDNAYVYASERLETYILLDEFYNIEKSGSFEDEHFYRPYLNNVLVLDSSRYLIQLSHIGVSEGQAYFRSEFKLIAHKTSEGFRFASPLIDNTKDWQQHTIGNCTFYYAEHINQVHAEEYVSLSKVFDNKLGISGKQTKIYCTPNRLELLQLMGVDYKLDYNGRMSGVFSLLSGNDQLILLGNNNAQFDNFDPHDLWHDRLSLRISRRKVNRPVDEGCAYIYGGSWGLSWEIIFSQFMEKVAHDKSADWAQYKEEPHNFADTQTEHLMVDYVVNALIIQKLESEQGFEAVWKLLNCGPYEAGNENYYKVLEALAGISKKNYNRAVWKLIAAEQK